MDEVHHMHMEKIHSQSALLTEVVVVLQGVKTTVPLDVRNLLIEGDNIRI